MVWVMTFSTSHIFVKTVSGRINSDTYIAYEKHCHPFNERHSPNDFDLQQDNGSIHVSKKVWTFLRRHELSFYLCSAGARTSKL